MTTTVAHGSGGAPDGAPPESHLRRLRLRASEVAFRRPRLRLSMLVGPPVAWVAVVYLGALVLLLATAFWRLDEFSGEVQRGFFLDNFRALAEGSTYRGIVVRTVSIALVVTVADVVLAFPVAYYAARIAGPRVRAAVLMLAVLPLWSSYLVRVFAWRTILSEGGMLSWASERLHLGAVDIGFSNTAVAIVFVYLWLPFVLLPMYAALERIPASYFEASADLGAKGWRTFRSVVLPLAWPGIVAGSIFSFSLTLGDYIEPQLVGGGSQFIGNVVYSNVGVANNVPFAAAFATVPVVIVAIYLFAARRTGAFEAL